MKTINVGPMFGANETRIHILDKSEQNQESYGFVLSSGECIVVRSSPATKMQEHCLKIVKKQEDNLSLGGLDKHSPIYVDIVIDNLVIGIICTTTHRVNKIRLSTDIDCV